MQIIDNLVVVHDLENRNSQIFDMKLSDYHLSLVDNSEISIEWA